MIFFRTANAQETLNLGEWIGKRLPNDSVVGLNGDLGVGKTWLSKGLVNGIGEFDYQLVKSPAYNLVHHYEVLQETQVIPVFHMDFYRLDTLSQTDYLLFSEYLETNGAICLVEWANKFFEEIMLNYLSITLSLCRNLGPTYRDLTIEIVGETNIYNTLLEELQHYESLNN